MGRLFHHMAGEAYSRSHQCAGILPELPVAEEQVSLAGQAGCVGCVSHTEGEAVTGTVSLYGEGMKVTYDLSLWRFCVEHNGECVMVDDEGEIMALIGIEDANTVIKIAQDEREADRVELERLKRELEDAARPDPPRYDTYDGKHWWRI